MVNRLVAIKAWAERMHAKKSKDLGQKYGQQPKVFRTIYESIVDSKNRLKCKIDFA